MSGNVAQRACRSISSAAESPPTPQATSKVGASSLASLFSRRIAGRGVCEMGDSPGQWDRNGQTAGKIDEGEAWPIDRDLAVNRTMWWREFSSSQRRELRAGFSTVAARRRRPFAASYGDRKLRLRTSRSNMRSTSRPSRSGASGSPSKTCR